MIMEPTNPVNQVISALKEHNLPVKREEIEPFFQQDDANAKWVSDHLRHETLLSQEELELYSRLESSGSLQNLHDTDVDVTRPLLDDDIQSAIHSLNASTAAVRKQTEVLFSQFESASKQSRLEGGRLASRNSDIARLRMKHETGCQNINAAATELNDELEQSLRRETEKAGVERKAILSSLTARLKDDDRKLASLQRAATGVDSTGDDQAIIERVLQLSPLLAEYTADEVYCRLDRLYLDSLRGDGTQQNGQSGYADADGTVAALEGELDELYPEIGDLAQMSAEQQFNQPIMRELRSRHDHERLAAHTTLEYVLDTLGEMTSSTESLADYLQTRGSISETLESINGLFQKQVRDQSRSERKNPRRSMHSPKKLIAQPPESPALDSLLRRLGLSSESVLRSEDNAGPVHLHEKKSHMFDSQKNLGSAVYLALESELCPSDSATQLLSTSLHSNSRFRTSLSAVDLDKRLSELETQLGLIQKGTEQLDLDVLHQRDRNQVRFMDRWR